MTLVHFLRKRIRIIMTTIMTMTTTTTTKITTTTAFPVSLLATTAAATTTSRRYRATVLFALCTILLFADQNLLSPNLTAIAQEFGFTAAERDQKLGGDLALAFFLLGAPASYVVGCLADSNAFGGAKRIPLFAATVCIGESACLLTYWTTTYAQLYVCRAVTGFSIGGALPLIYSILGDWFAADERHSVSAVVGVGTGIGIAVGQGLAGFLGPTYGWRLPFLIVSIPAILCAILVWCTVPEPERGRMERVVLQRQSSSSSSSLPIELGGGGDDGDNNAAAEDSGHASNDSSSRRRNPELTHALMEMVAMDAGSGAHGGERQAVMRESSGGKVNSEEEAGGIMAHHHGFDCQAHWDTFRSLLSTNTVRLALLQGGPGCVPWGICNMYLNDYLAVDCGMSVQVATMVVLCFGLGNFVGMLGGGGAAMYLYRIDPRYPPLLAGVAAMLGCIPFWVLLNRIHGDTTPFFVMATVAWLAGVGSGVTGPIIKAQLQNVTLPQERGQAFALFNTTDDVGRGLGPVFVATLIAQYGGRRTPAFNVGVLGWVICGFLNLAIYYTIVADERNMQMRLVSGSSPTSWTQHMHHHHKKIESQEDEDDENYKDDDHDYSGANTSMMMTTPYMETTEHPFPCTVAPPLRRRLSQESEPSIT